MAKTEIFGIDKTAADNDLKKNIKKTEPEKAPEKKKETKLKTAIFGE